MAVFAVISAKTGVADWYAGAAWSAQEGWQSRAETSGQLPSTAEWGAVQENLAAANSLDAGNPGLIEQQGNLYMVRVKDGESFQAHYTEARDRFAQAVVLRPTSAYSWSNLAWSKYQLGELDATFYQAMANAARLGPWEPEVQFVVTDLGLALWDEMPVALRAPVLQMAQNGSRRYAPGIMTIAEKRGRLPVVCGFEKLASFESCRRSILS